MVRFLPKLSFLRAATCVSSWSPGASRTTPLQGGQTGSKSTAGLGSGLGLLGILGAWLLGSAENECLADGQVGENRREKGETLEKGAGFHLVDLETRKRTFFKYEKRIRSLSTPEKIFEYFSSVEEGGRKSMTHQDLLRALTAVYPPEGSSLERSGALLGERAPVDKAPGSQAQAIFSLFDTDGDNQISYSEFILLMTLMSIPVQDAELIFDIVDLDDNGVVDYTEFMTVILQIQNQTPQTKKNLGGIRTGLNVGDTSKPVGILAKFFGEDGSKKLVLAEFKSFLHDLHNRFVLLEFNHYDYKSSKKIAGKDFARSMCCGADIKRVDSYLDKVNAMDPELGSHGFELEEFISYYSLLRHFNALSAALRFVYSTQGSVGRKEFKSIVQKVGKVKLTDKIVELVFLLFSADDDKLNCGAFLEAFLKHRNTHVLVQDTDGSGLKKSFAQCIYACCT